MQWVDVETLQTVEEMGLMMDVDESDEPGVLQEAIVLYNAVQVSRTPP